MPYIKQYERGQYDRLIQEVVDALTRSGGVKPNVGHINYVLSSILWKMFDLNPRYETANDLAGVLTCVQAEFQRRKVAPYEDKKIEENGDIDHETNPTPRASLRQAV